MMKKEAKFNAILWHFEGNLLEKIYMYNLFYRNFNIFIVTHFAFTATNDQFLTKNLILLFNS